jgi:hypothetical protein
MLMAAGRRRVLGRVPAEFEVDEATVFVAALPPAVRQAGDDFQAAAVLGTAVKRLRDRRTKRAVVADLDPERARPVVNGDLERAAVSRLGMI